jgi:hypothetical protein
MERAASSMGNAPIRINAGLQLPAWCKNYVRERFLRKVCKIASLCGRWRTPQPLVALQAKGSFEVITSFPTVPGVTQ